MSDYIDITDGSVTITEDAIQVIIETVKAVNDPTQTGMTLHLGLPDGGFTVGLVTLSAEDPITHGLDLLNAATLALSRSLSEYVTADDLNNALAGEVTARNSAISAAVAAEATARNTAIASAIATEVTNRNSAISSALVGYALTSDLSSAIGAEASTRGGADAALDGRLTAVEGVLPTLATSSALSAAISTEVTNRNSAISSAITTEITNRNTAISAAVGAEASARDTAIAVAIAAYNPTFVQVKAALAVASTAVDFNGQAISIGEPLLQTDAATKGYVDDTPWTIITANYTIVAADHGKTFLCKGSSTPTLTLDNNLPDSFEFKVVALNANAWIVVAASGEAFQLPGSFGTTLIAGSGAGTSWGLRVARDPGIYNLWLPISSAGVATAT